MRLYRDADEGGELKVIKGVEVSDGLVEPGLRSMTGYSGLLCVCVFNKEGQVVRLVRALLVT
jgi:hypothetical protein